MLIFVIAVPDPASGMQLGPLATQAPLHFLSDSIQVKVT